VRDLREDLRQRLQALALERATLSERLAYLDQIEVQTKNLLEYEVMRIQAGSAAQQGLFTDTQIADSQRSDLSLFLRDALSDGTPRPLGYLKRAAQKRQIDFGGKNPGRVLHFALTGMAQNGIVEMEEKGVWRLTPTQ